MKELIERLRMMQSALGVDGTCGEAADALERMVTELETANRNMTYCCYCGGKVEEEIK